MKYLQLEEEIEQIDNFEDFFNFINKIRPLCSNKKSSFIEQILDKAINRCKAVDAQNSLISLYDLKIRQLYHNKNKLPEALEVHAKMCTLATKLDDDTGLALAYQLKWHIEKLRGNKKISSRSIRKAIEIIESSTSIDDYTRFFCYYSSAVENWLEYRDFSSSTILEECIDFFYSTGYYHGLAMSLGVLIIIYQQTQNREESMKLIRRILSRRNLLLQMPKEILSIVHFFIGFSHELSFNLNNAENHLLESQAILRPIYRKSIYSGYYVTTLSYLTSTYALQGKLELALKQMKEVEELMEEGIVTRNLDSFNKEQLKHIFNLTKFYIHSRLQNFRIEDIQELVQTIFNNIGNYHSNAMFFSEFLMNAELTKEQLIKIKNLNNPSTKRVEHIINFLIEKTTHAEEQQIINYISVLKKRPVEKRMTFLEKAYADLLAAREYYKINRFAEIYPLLKKYENNLHKIEILEMRVFIEAFIQVGAYKNGDPLEPALQYMAIKKCRQYGFSRLENSLLDYLNMQGNDALRMLA